MRDFMAFIKPTMSHPLMIRMKNKTCYIAQGSCEYTMVLSLNKKVSCDGACGITIFTESGNKRCYGTQLGIESVELKDDRIIIYEEGKSIPWEIDKEGYVICRARFDSKAKSDVTFLKDEFGYTRRDIPYLNDYEPYMDYKKKIEERVVNPVLIYLNDEEYTDKGYFDKEGHFTVPLSSLKGTIIAKSLEVEYSLKSGVLFDPSIECYGFNIVSARKTLSFPTQCAISCIALEDDLIKIYEVGKKIPWSIDGDLVVREYAQFLEISRRDIAYLNEKFGLTEENVADVNEYGLQYVKKS